MKKSKNLQKGETMQLHDQTHCTTLTIWKNSSIVYILDNCINPFAPAELQRRKKRSKGGGFDTFVVPYVCRFYNVFIGNCDAAGSH